MSKSGSEKSRFGDMPKEEFRKFGHQLVDQIADYFEEMEELPVLSQIEPGSLKSALPDKTPETGEPFENVIEDLEDKIFSGDYTLESSKLSRTFFDVYILSWCFRRNANGGV